MRALFLGKFQPPHLGHVRTILKIADEYSQVTIGITMGDTRVIEYGHVKEIFDEVFAKNSKIQTCLIKGTIEGGNADISSLPFDVILSGNQKILEILKLQGFLVKYHPRTIGKGYSGSEIRSIINNDISSNIACNAEGYDFKIALTADLKPLERIYPQHYKNIEKIILNDGVINKPIIIDAEHNIVLDGSHRYAFLLNHGYKYAPVITVNYNSDAVFVGNHLKHRYLTDNNFVISKAEVVSRALSESLFDPRTTRHFFPFRKKDYPVALAQLEKGNDINIDWLIHKCSVEEEIIANKHYISEIDEEIEVIEDYISEQKGVKKYLSYQIIEMKKNSNT